MILRQTNRSIVNAVVGPIYSIIMYVLSTGVYIQETSEFALQQSSWGKTFSDSVGFREYLNNICIL